MTAQRSLETLHPDCKRIQGNWSILFVSFGHYQESLIFPRGAFPTDRFVFLLPALRENARPNRRTSVPQTECLHSRETWEQTCQLFFVIPDVTTKILALTLLFAKYIFDTKRQEE